MFQVIAVLIVFLTANEKKEPGEKYKTRQQQDRDKTV